MDPQFSRSQNQSNEKLWRQQCGVKMVVQSDLRNGHLNLIPKSFVVRSVSSLFSNCMFVRFLFATVARTQFAIGLRCIALSAPLLLSRSGSKEDEFDQILLWTIFLFSIQDSTRWYSCGRWIWSDVARNLAKDWCHVCFAIQTSCCHIMINQESPAAAIFYWWVRGPVQRTSTSFAK